MRCEAPDDLLRHLWSRGFDATRGAWSLYPVPAPAERPDATAPEAHEVMGRIVYLPVYPGVRTREFERLAGALAEFKRLSPAAVAAEGSTRELAVLDAVGLVSFDAQTASSAGLVEGPDGAFYGTSGGGAYRAGAVYSITPAGEVTILHSFTGSSGGLGPRDALVRVGDDFYGTTSAGGVDLPTSPGTVFRVSASDAPCGFRSLDLWRLAPGLTSPPC